MFSMAQITQQQLNDYINSKDGLTVSTYADFTRFPNPSGSGAINVLDLSGLDFSYLNLLSATVGNGCNFSNTLWLNTTISNATLQSRVAATPTNFTNAVFTNVNASSSFPGLQFNLSRSTMANVKMRECNFAGGFLQTCNFTNADIKNCDFSKVWFNGSTFDSTTVIESCDFSSSLFIASGNTQVELNGVTFINCNFTDAYFLVVMRNATFINCNFTDARVSFTSTIANQSVTYDACSFEQFIFFSSANVTVTVKDNCYTAKTLFF